jgi:hypothetical protein
VIGSNLLVGSPDAALTTGTIVTTALPAADAATGGVAAPSSGVITSWTIELRTSDPGNTFVLRVIDGNTAIATGRTYPVPTTAGIHSFTQRLPIKAGQLAGLAAVVRSGVIPLLRNNVVDASSDSWGATPFPDEATFTFSSATAGVNFECALDSSGFSDCASPKKVKKLTNGTHLSAFARSAPRA